MKERGVTLIEVVVTMTIIMVLASVAAPLARISATRAREIELRQHLRTVRAAIDAFRQDWNRDGDVLLGPLCVENKLTCKVVSGLSGYPKSLEVLLEVTLSEEEATVKGSTIRRYLRKIPMDPMTSRIDWRLRCHADPPHSTSWCGEDAYDISSSSSEIALDGTRYREW